MFIKINKFIVVLLILYTSDTNISNYYEYIEQKGTYTIICIKGNYILDVDGISLRIFNPNIAILTFNLQNTKYSDVESILAINEFGRRTYPQFLSEDLTKGPKGSFLADEIKLDLNNQMIEENFTYYDKLDNFTNPTLLPKMPKFILSLFESNFEEKNSIKPIIDDRMFTISWYGNDQFSNMLREENYKTNPKWYEYIFVDGYGKNIYSDKMQEKLITDATYDRWMDNPYGCTLYGMSRYSFVTITNESDFAKEVILPHVQTMYFQIFTLLLAYRAIIIKISNDIQDALQESSELGRIKSARKTYKQYLDFLNRLYFKEPTAQDQGIELYKKAMNSMNIKEYMNELDNEINELFSYVEMITEKRRNKSLDTISKMGAYLLPPSMVFTAWGGGMNSFITEYLGCNELTSMGIAFIVSIIGIALSYFIFLKKENHE